MHEGAMLTSLPCMQTELGESKIDSTALFEVMMEVRLEDRAQHARHRPPLGTILAWEVH